MNAKSPFPGFEMPTDFQDMATEGLKQARSAYDQYMDALGQMSAAAGETPGVTQGFKELGDKMVSFTKENMERNFALAETLSKATDIKDALDAQGDYARNQIEALSKQTEALGGLMTKLADPGKK